MTELPLEWCSSSHIDESNIIMFKINEDDLELKAERALLDLTETICMIHPEQRFPIRFLLKCIEWFADKAIYWKI